MDFKRDVGKDSRFFPGGVTPDSADEIDSFAQKALILSQDELAIFADEVKELGEEDLARFCRNIVPSFSTEKLLATVFHCPEAIRKMTSSVARSAFTTLYDKKHDCYIRKEFFETAMLNLAVNSPGSLGLIHRFIGTHFSRGDRPEWFISGSADQAFAKRFISRMADAPMGYTEAHEIWGGLSKFELPETLGAYVKTKIVSGDAGFLSSLIGEMAQDNLLSDRYIAVLRDIVGDDFFLKSCKNCLSQEFGFYSTLQLLPIYGEAALHDQKFLSGLQWGVNSDVPKYIETFSKVDFNENKLPLLADYVLSKMNHMLKDAPDGIKDFEIQVRFCNLAGRMGRGDDALHRLAQILSPPDSDLRQPSRIFEAILAKLSAPAPSRREEAAYKLLARSIGKLGLETLHRVAPDVSGRFVVDILDWVPTDLTRREIFRLFPQAKGSLLENDLGI